jgi:xanthine dehydrogenase small subunit
MRTSVRFLRRGQTVELADIEPAEMLLDHLRLREGACGTKEGCAEGDCGACTVALGRLVAGKLVYQPVNSCILMTGMADGADVVAVDDLAGEDVEGGGPLHPVQQAMVDYHGSQCGFCTPGFVMSLFTLYQSGKVPDRKTVTDWLAGNLCRCTGYRPIVDAALASCSGNPADSHARNAAATAVALGEISDTEDLFVGNGERFFAAPASLRSLADLYSDHPDATLVGGATDVGLWVTKQLRDLPKIIHVGRVAGFDTIKDEPDALVIGAGATYAQAEAQLAAIDPDVAELLRRLGSKQVRASGTIGGNIANASPVGDTPPLLIALDAIIALNRGGKIRTLPLDSYFLAYGKQDRQPGEFVQSVRVPQARRQPALALLQDLKALRPGHLRRPRRLPLHRGERRGHGGLRRLRRHGGHTQARSRHRSRPCRRPARRRDLVGRCACGAGARLHAHLRPARQRRIPDRDRSRPPAQGAARTLRCARHPRHRHQGGTS